MQGLGCSRIHYVIEATGVYSEAVGEYLSEAGAELKLSVINPYQAKSFGKTLGIRTKNDKVDAGLLAFYGARIKPEPMGRISGELKELKVLVRHLEYLTNRRGQERGRLEGVTNPVVKDSIEQIIRGYDKQIEEIEKAIEEHIKKHPELRHKLELVETIPGIGRITSRILLCELHSEDGSGGKVSAKAQSAHAGLAPQEKSSGTSVRGQAHICRTGSSRLRKCLYFPAVSAIRHNEVIRRFYKRLVDKGKPKKVALVAAMRKLLVIAVGVLNNGVPFDVNWTAQRKISMATP